MNKSEKENSESTNSKDIFERLKAGELIRLDDPEYSKIQEVVNRTIRLSSALNTSTDIDQIRERLSEIIGSQLDQSTTVFAPIYTNCREVCFRPGNYKEFDNMTVTAMRIF